MSCEQQVTLGGGRVFVLNDKGIGGSCGGAAGN